MTAVRWSFQVPKASRCGVGIFSRHASWPHAVHAIGEDGLHFHDLRHINAIDAHVEPEQGHTDHVSIASRARRGRQGPLAVTGLPSARC